MMNMYLQKQISIQNKRTKIIFYGALKFLEEKRRIRKNPLVTSTDPRIRVRIRIRNKMSLIPNTWLDALFYFLSNVSSARAGTLC
jgi:hypothetical protein